MENDDRMVGSLLSRREVVALFGVTGTAWAAGLLPAERRGGMAVPSCVVRPAQTEGPYFVDERLDRSDIRSDPTDGSLRKGAPLVLTMLVAQVDRNQCRPVAGAMVDIWQCDAEGVYSDAQDRSFDTRGRKFLRGYQVTNAAGEARFTTIYPGWYPGRAVHIHFKVRTEPRASRGREFTSQLYFDDAYTDSVFGREPYSARGPRSTRNAGDRIYQGSGGDQLLLDVVAAGNGYAGTFAVGLEA